MQQKPGVVDEDFAFGCGAITPATEMKLAHELFEDCAEGMPQKLALVCGDRQFTYAELNSRGSQIAIHLRMKGAGPNTVVAISVERSLEMAVGILAVLKVGAAFVLLDPDCRVRLCSR